MQVETTHIPGLFVIKPKVFEDGRGFFMESWNKDVLDAKGLKYDWIQDNHARSGTLGVLRGLHFQLPPSAQSKLVRVSNGAVYDVVVDLRQGSPTYGQWHGVELSAENHLQLLIPRGFAHGYKTLTEIAEFQYKVDAYYDAKRDAGIAWNDPDLNIEWPGGAPLLSDKDMKLPLLKDFDSPFVYEG
ncbi:dTDP-4-dehydrorhamnose 3,5-epimerase [Desulfovibrio ferrophilus]|uniref:dTDP-4-dehydrorhamnose 3,5-epimerase n=1 Tax=Desulfovibrio ferrophilus TaxID=241368 RepID=A0A2Z6AZT3_9BACT|nr:dTDP-4-dehydrorhamnose 3,5-epimerase [Desulfovibrio ferrophilus]BBD08728.1 dTDP-4-dehydrorhamnose 3,5-epimerase [Desulfovibrio ferrophilus]